jgi:hypothetical protein
MINALTAAPGNQKVFGRQDLNRYWVLRLTDVNQGNSSNIFHMLPGGGPSKVLGLDTYAGVPEYSNHPTWPVAPLQPNGPQVGTIKNILLAQTITLYFNTTITGSTLASVPLGCELILADRTCGSLEPPPPPYDTIDFFSYPAIVYITNPANGYPATVAGLLQLANDALGGVNISGLSLSQINDAVSAINETFDECRLLVGTICGQTNPRMVVNNNGSAPAKQPIIEQAVSQVSVTPHPNPFNDNIKFLIQSEISGQATLEVYNLAGAKLQVVYSGYLVAGKGRIIEYKVPELYRTNLIYVFKIGGRIVTGKVINIR